MPNFAGHPTAACGEAYSYYRGVIKALLNAA